MAKKQEKNSIPLLAGAIGFGIIAALLAMFYLNTREAQLKAKYEQDKAKQVMVVVATADLRKGQEIKANLFSQRPVPAKFVHDDAVSPSQFNRYIGRALVTNLGRGKTLLKSFMDDDFPRDFSDIVPPGKRAITITVDDVNSIGGFLRPGNRIDVYVNIPFATSGISPATIIAAKEAGLLDLLPQEAQDMIPEELLAATDTLESPEELIGSISPTDVIIPVIQNITVLATGRDPYSETLDALRQPQRRTESHFSHITIEVTPEQAALITLAEDKGDMLALLRNRNDQSASDFTYVEPTDLFGNAARMAAAEKERASRAAAAAGVDINGNLVDANGNKLVSSKQLEAAGIKAAGGVDRHGNLVGADGKVIASRAELEAAGYTVNEHGQIIDKNGNVVDPSKLLVGKDGQILSADDVVVTADGKIMTKEQLAAAGLTVNESGQIIDKNGNVVDAADVVLTADGKVMTKKQLEASGLSVNDAGEIVDANGKVVSANDVVVTEDGTVLTKEQLAAAGIQVASGTDSSGNLVDANGNVIASREQLEAAGYTINENGEIVDKDGNIVDPSSIMVAADGKVISSNDLLIAADGSVLSKEQLAAAGLSVNEHGQIVDKDGNIVDPNTLVVASDGSVMTKEQLAAAGLSINENGEIVDANGNVIDKTDLITSANGEILSKKQLAAAGIKVASGTDSSGNLVDANGRVIASREQLEAAGYTINENGEIVDKDGNIVDPSNIMIAANGEVLSPDEIAQIAESQTITGKTVVTGQYDLIIGGASEDGVAKSKKISVPSEKKDEKKP